MTSESRPSVHTAMPGVRRQARPSRRGGDTSINVNSDELVGDEEPDISQDAVSGGGLDDEPTEHDEDELDEEGHAGAGIDDPLSSRLPPPGLKEISSLASWTVTSSKPGCGVSALRSPSTALFWQSDGPQPHLLSLHFFKLVSIAHMRIFLDFDNDESYTPTKIQFLAGMGPHDLQEFAEMNFVEPRGWIDVDFGGVGPIEEDVEMMEDEDEGRVIDWERRPVLRAFIVQVRIVENHQNGKDTHLRGLQIFARDQMEVGRVGKTRTEEVAAPLRMAERPRRAEVQPLKKASWMMEPDLR